MPLFFHYFFIPIANGKELSRAMLKIFACHYLKKPLKIRITSFNSDSKNRKLFLKQNPAIWAGVDTVLFDSSFLIYFGSGIRFPDKVKGPFDDEPSPVKVSPSNLRVIATRSPSTYTTNFASLPLTLNSSVGIKLSSAP